MRNYLQNFRVNGVDFDVYDGKIDEEQAEKVANSINEVYDLIEDKSFDEIIKLEELKTVDLKEWEDGTADFDFRYNGIEGTIFKISDGSTEFWETVSYVEGGKRVNIDWIFYEE